MSQLFQADCCIDDQAFCAANAQVWVKENDMFGGCHSSSNSTLSQVISSLDRIVVDLATIIRSVKLAIAQKYKAQPCDRHLFSGG